MNFKSFIFVVTFAHKIILGIGSLPGEPCHPITDKCVDIRSTCLSDGNDFFCFCNVGYFIFNGPGSSDPICSPFPQKPLENCDSVVAPCAPQVPHSICENFQCHCAPGYGHDIVNQRCIPIPSSPGDICQRDSVSCDTTNIPTICGGIRPELGESVCECSEPDMMTDVKYKRCLKIPSKPGDECTSRLTNCEGIVNTTCTAISEPEIGTCNCDGDFVTNPDLGICMTTPKKPGDICDLTYTPCHISGVTDTSCEANSTDLSPIHTCQCHLPLVTDFFAGNCLTMPEHPGDPCHSTLTPCDPSTHTTCEVDSPGGITYCKCHPDYVHIPEKKTCLKLPKIPGDECHPQVAPCPSEQNITCTYSDDLGFRCTCFPDFFLLNPNPGNTDPLCSPFPNIPLDNCDEDLAPCSKIPNTICENHQCACAPGNGHDTVNKRCIPIPLLPGDICQTDSVTCEDTNIPTSCGEIRPELKESVCECSQSGLITDVKYKRCLKIPSRPGDECTTQLTPCNNIINTTCTTPPEPELGFCKCDGDLVTNTAMGLCLKKPENPGDTCDPTFTPCGLEGEDTICDRNSSQGIPINTCQCKQPLITNHFAGTCLKKPKYPGDPCHSTLTPCDPYTKTLCEQDSPEGISYCKCQGDYINIPEDMSCLKLPRLAGDECHPIRAPCPFEKNITCSIGDDSIFICTCNFPFFTDFIKQRCLLMPESVHDPCHPISLPCTRVPQTLCLHDEMLDDTICKCRPDFIYNPGNNSCLSAPLLPGDSCIPGVMECFGVPNATTCAPYPGGGGHYCKCDGDLVNDPEKRRCISIPQFPMDTCHPQIASCHSKPVPNTECLMDTDERRCICNFGFSHDRINRRCVSNPELPGDACNPGIPSHCAGVGNTTCQNSLDGHICKCIGDLITEGGRCFPRPISPGDRCSFTQATCSLVRNTTCAEDELMLYPYCKCIEGFFNDFVAKTCVPIPTFPGDECLPGSSQCQEIDPNSYCQEDTRLCVCLPDFFQSFSGICRRLPEKPMEYCELTPHCSLVNGTICLSSACICIPGEYDISKDGEKCLKKNDFLFEPCESDQQCTKLNNSVCSLEETGGKLTCQCRPNTFPGRNNQTCLEVVDRIGDRCFEDIQCQMGIGEATCDPVLGCQCKPLHIPSEDLSRCLSGSGPGVGCQDDRQCQLVMGPSSRCDPFNHTCSCYPNATLYLGRCHMPAFLHDPCTLTTECLLGAGENSICSPQSGKCQCSPGTIEKDGRCLSGLRLGDPCKTREECEESIDGFVLCHAKNNTCICMAGFIAASEYECLYNGSSHLENKLTALFVVGLVFHFVNYFLETM